MAFLGERVLRLGEQQARPPNAPANAAGWAVARHLLGRGPKRQKAQWRTPALIDSTSSALSRMPRHGKEQAQVSCGGGPKPLLLQAPLIRSSVGAASIHSHKRTYSSAYVAVSPQYLARGSGPHDFDTCVQRRFHVKRTSCDRRQPKLRKAKLPCICPASSWRQISGSSMGTDSRLRTAVVSVTRTYPPLPARALRAREFAFLPALSGENEPRAIPECATVHDLSTALIVVQLYRMKAA